MKKHADSVWKAVASRADISVHARSWRRCVTLHQLDPEAERRPARVDGSTLDAARDRSGELRAVARDEIDRLAETLVRAGCCLALSDADGLILDRRGAPGDDDHFRAVDLWDGALWTEAAAGTNAIGTALTERRATAIHRDEHFLTRNTSLSCAAAPIRDHRGRVAGSLDVSTCRRDATEAVLGLVLQLVGEAAGRIETKLFHHAFPGARVVLAPGAGGQTGLLALDQDDIVIGANQATRRHFQIDDAFLAQERPAAELLGEASDEEDCAFLAAERRAVRSALARTGGNVSAAARELGVSRATLHRKLKRLEIR